MQIFYLSLFLAAQTLTGYQTSKQMPNVEIVPQEYLEEKYCKGEACGLNGIYGGGDTIYISDVLSPRDNQIHASIVLHEFVHFLQQDRDKYDIPKLNCPKFMALEKEAYLVQFRYLNNLGIDTPGINPASFNCN